MRKNFLIAKKKDNVFMKINLKGEKIIVNKIF